tara:strand:+ start:1277 stop:1648 length:372 start_codon:yes stop_codon:yes gene_type:complete
MKAFTSISILGICLGVGIYLFLLPTKTGELEELKTKETPRSINLPANNPDPDYQWASSNSKYEIRIQNDVTDERLETVTTLEEALAYLKQYSMHHNDLFVYDISSGTLVAGMAEGSSFEMAVD